MILAAAALHKRAGNIDFSRNWSGL